MFSKQESSSALSSLETDGSESPIEIYSLDHANGFTVTDEQREKLYEALFASEIRAQIIYVLHGTTHQISHLTY